jgi:hypothetical protein
MNETGAHLTESPGSARLERLLIALVLLASLLELAAPITVLSSTREVTWMLAIALVYQAGYLVVLVIRFPRPHISVAMCVLSVILVAGARSSLLIELPAIFLASAGIQLSKNWIAAHAKLSSGRKTLARFSGYALAGISWLFPLTLFIALVVSAGLVTILLSRNVVVLLTPKRKRFPVDSFRGLFEFAHHAHYFAYCYVLLAIVILLGPGLSWTSGAFFVIGWLGYALFQGFLRSGGAKSMALGHIGNAGVLGILLVAGVNYFPLLLVAWALTGIGGGTAFLLDGFHEGPQTLPSRESFENLGHTVGVFSALCAVLFLGIAGVFAVGVGFSVLAGVSAMAPRGSEIIR